jgi:hypothetical protein
MLTRREFLSHAVEATVGFVVAPFAIGACSSSSSDDGSLVRTTSPTEPACDGAAASSTVSDSHVHTVCVPLSNLSAPPPEGVRLATSTTLDHRHDVTLTVADLVTVAAGGTATVVTTVVNGHTHGFTVRRATRPTSTGSGPY